MGFGRIAEATRSVHRIMYHGMTYVRPVERFTPARNADTVVLVSAKESGRRRDLAHPRRRQTHSV